MPELRLHLTAGDLARTRLVADPDVVWETALSLDLLRSPAALAPGPLSSWRAWARRRLGDWARPLLAPTTKDPAAEGPEFLKILQQQERTSWTPLLDRYRTTVVTPVWPMISAAFVTDHGRRMHDLLGDGLEGLLGGLAPSWRWQAPVLATEHPVELDQKLSGHGLLVIPCYFAPGRPIVRPDPHGPTVLVHPIGPGHRIPFTPDQPAEDRSHGLDALIGATRAAMLEALTEGCNTTELARRVGVSAGSASQHTRVLRQAGLIRTHRQGATVEHTVTALGSAVLRC